MGIAPSAGGENERSLNKVLTFRAMLHTNFSKMERGMRPSGPSRLRNRIKFA